MLDIKVTHGSYWYGAQIPYWVYIVLTILPFTGFFGLDHLALRSPLTAFLKFIANIPLFGYWYFYDIAQALGERELLEKYGIAVPFFGPTGIGAGIFSGSKDFPEAPKQVPRPWKYMLYALTTCIFIAFPINKLVIGDYWGALAQLLMYACFFTIITPILAVAWGLYDIYRVGFDTKGLFEKGAARFLPASWVMAPYFRRDAMGSLPAVIVPPNWVGNIVEKVGQVPIAAAQASTEVIGEVRNASKDLVHEVSNASTGAVAKLSNSSTGLVGEVINASREVVAEGRKATDETIHNIQSIVSSPAKANIVGSTLELTKGAVKELSNNAKEVGNRAVEGMERFPVIISKVATGAAHNIAEDTVVPVTKAITETTAAVQKGVENTTAAATAIANNATKAASNIAEHAASNVSQGIINRVNAVTGELGQQTTDTYKHITNNAASAAAALEKDAVKVANTIATNPGPVVGATTNMLTDVSQNLGKIGEHIAKDGEKVANALQQTGGALVLSSDPSFTTVIILFSLGFVAVSGYIFYTLRKLDKQPVEKSDDPPGESRAVRESAKPSK